MKVNINSNIYKIRWQYNEIEVKTSKNNLILDRDDNPIVAPQTTCLIEIFNTTKEAYDIVAEEHVSKFHMDEFDKDIARKQSLKKCLDKLFPHTVLKYDSADYAIREIPVEPTTEELSGVRLERISDEELAEIHSTNFNNKVNRQKFWNSYNTRNEKNTSSKVLNLYPVKELTVS